MDPNITKIVKVSVELVVSQITTSKYCTVKVNYAFTNCGWS